MTFMEAVLGEEFIAYVGANMRRIIMDIVRQAGGSAEWEDQFALPQAVQARVSCRLLT